LGNKIITLLSCPISLAIGFLYEPSINSQQHPVKSSSSVVYSPDGGHWGLSETEKQLKTGQHFTSKPQNRKKNRSKLNNRRE